MTSTLPTLLVIDDEAIVRRAVERTLSAQGYHVLTAEDGETGLEILGKEQVDVALIDIRLPGISGLDVLREVAGISPFTECIVFTGHTDVATAFSSLESGASDYFEKPIRDWPRFNQVLRRATEVNRLKRERQQLQRRAGSNIGSLLGNSEAMEGVGHMVESVADSMASILIMGESGVGKEMVAEAIHQRSGRKGEYVGINCAAVPPDLIEGELFGWEKGAHSTASQTKPGLFEVAGAGTILLDEIGDMPLDLQAKLLRVLESKTFRRLGGTEELTMTARILAATHQDLEKNIELGTFRQDLYFRINVVSIEIPPLRERAGDIALLTYHFIQGFNEEEGREVRRVEPDLLQALEAYQWPGNVRELRNVLHRAVLLSDGESLLASGLPDTIIAGRSLRSPVATSTNKGVGKVHPLDAYLVGTYKDAKQSVVEDFTRKYVENRLEDSGGNISKAAAASGMQRPNFRRLMKQFGIEAQKEETD